MKRHTIRVLALAMAIHASLGAAQPPPLLDRELLDAIEPQLIAWRRDIHQHPGGLGGDPQWMDHVASSGLRGRPGMTARSQPPTLVRRRSSSPEH